MTTLSQIFSQIPGKLHGTARNKIGELYNKCWEAANNVLLRVDPPTTVRSARIENAIYDKVFNYVAAEDLKGEASVVDIRPIGPRSNQDSIDGRYQKEFDIKKKIGTYAVETVNGVKTLRLSKCLTPRTILNNCSSLDLNGTIEGDANISELEVSYIDYISEGGCLRFDLDASTTTATLTFEMDYAVDLSRMSGAGALFFWLNFPDAARFNSVTLRWGSDSSNYWYKAITAPHDRTALESGAWSLMRADWNTASVEGTPDATAIDFMELVFSYDTGVELNSIRVDSITAALGEAYEMQYYSEYLFKGINGTWKATPTLDTDIVMLPNDGINLFMYELFLLIFQDVKGDDAKADVLVYGTKLEKAYQIFEDKYPSKAVMPSETYYSFSYENPDGSTCDDSDCD